MDLTKCVTLKFGDSSCAIDTFGATLVSWNFKGEDLIFVSSLAHFDGKKAIRGGIPLVFPCFGPWEAGPQHGFARIQRWTVHQQPETGNDNCRAVLCLEDNEDTRSLWPHRFRLLYTVTLRAGSLQTELTIENTGDSTFSFTCLLHTYFKVSDVTNVTVSGLKGVTYVDKVRNGESFTEERENVTVTQNEDRVYAATPSEHVLRDPGSQRTITVVKSNLPDTVLWNPWREKAATMSDFRDDEFPRMLCVEAGHVSTPVTLEGGASFSGGQTLSVTTAAL